MKRPGDRIALAGIAARGHHGVLPEERVNGQEFVVDVELEVDLGHAGASDDLADTVNYAAVAADVVRIVEGPACDLIETVAERIAAAALGYDLVRAVSVTVHKPQAPVGVPFGDVSVTIRRRRRSEVVIALGSNLGDREATLRQAVARLRGVLGVRSVSAVVETDPVGGPEQCDYLNAVVVGVTDHSPSRLLAALHEIEADAGRTREVRWGPRTLDLDLIQYGDPAVGADVVSDQPALTLPHPRAAERAFVLVPWADADPGGVLRVGDRVVSVVDLASAAGADGIRPRPDVVLTGRRAR